MKPVFSICVALAASIACASAGHENSGPKIEFGGIGALMGSHFGALFKGLDLHGHGGGNIMLPPKHIFLPHGEPVAHLKHEAPVHVAHKHAAPIVHDHHHHHEAHLEGPVLHEAPVHHAPVHHAPVHHAPVHHAPVHHAPLHFEHHEAPVHHAPVHHVEVQHHTKVVHGPPHVKKPHPIYKGTHVIKKHIPSPGHHFSIHGYQLSLGKRPRVVLHKKHFFLHPAAVIVKPFVVKQKQFVKPIIKEEAAPILPVHEPAHEAPVFIKDDHHHHHHHHHEHAPVIAKEAPAFHGPAPEAPLVKILGPIFDAPLPVIGGHDAW